MGIKLFDDKYDKFIKRFEDFAASVRRGSSVFSHVTFSYHYKAAETFSDKEKEEFSARYGTRFIKTLSTIASKETKTYAFNSALNFLTAYMPVNQQTDNELGEAYVSLFDALCRHDETKFKYFKNQGHDFAKELLTRLSSMKVGSHQEGVINAYFRTILHYAAQNDCQNFGKLLEDFKDILEENPSIVTSEIIANIYSPFVKVINRQGVNKNVIELAAVLKNSIEHLSVADELIGHIVSKVEQDVEELPLDQLESFSKEEMDEKLFQKFYQVASAAIALNDHKFNLPETTSVSDPAVVLQEPGKVVYGVNVIFNTQAKPPVNGTVLRNLRFDHNGFLEEVDRSFLITDDLASGLEENIGEHGPKLAAKMTMKSKVNRVIV